MQAFFCRKGRGCVTRSAAKIFAWAERCEGGRVGNRALLEWREHAREAGRAPEREWDLPGGGRNAHAFRYGIAGRRVGSSARTSMGK